MGPRGEARPIPAGEIAALAGLRGWSGEYAWRLAEQVMALDRALLDLTQKRGKTRKEGDRDAEPAGVDRRKGR